MPGSHRARSGKAISITIIASMATRKGKAPAAMVNIEYLGRTPCMVVYLMARASLVAFSLIADNALVKSKYIKNFKKLLTFQPTKKDYSPRCAVL